MIMEFLMVRVFYKDRVYYIESPVSCCVPSKLVLLAQSLGCLFVLCPDKYGCRQFTNPDVVRKYRKRHEVQK